MADTGFHCTGAKSLGVTRRSILRAGGLLAYGLGPAGEALPPTSGPKTLFQKIVERHAKLRDVVVDDTGVFGELQPRRFHVSLQWAKGRAGP